jgi:hypothetical protein
MNPIKWPVDNEYNGVFLLCVFYSLPRRRLTEQSLDDVLSAICRHLKYDDVVTERLCKTAREWFEQENIFSLVALLQVCTEVLLSEAKLKPLWVYINDLQEKTGLAPVKKQKGQVGKKEKLSTPLSGDKLTKRKVECFKEWKEHSGCKKAALQISLDGLQFACTVCSTGEDLKWHRLKGPSDVRVHCIGGSTSKMDDDKKPEKSRHAKNVEQQKPKKKEKVPPPKKRTSARSKSTVKEERVEKKKR